MSKLTYEQKIGQAFYRLAEETLNEKVIAIEDENKELRKQLNLACVNQRSELLAIEALKKITKAHSETYSKQVAVEALKAIANCG